MSEDYVSRTNRSRDSYRQRYDSHTPKRADREAVHLTTQEPNKKRSHELIDPEVQPAKSQRYNEPAEGHSRNGYAQASALNPTDTRENPAACSSVGRQSSPDLTKLFAEKMKRQYEKKLAETPAASHSRFCSCHRCQQRKSGQAQ
ncbi:hypothetical protein WHR41_08235 [Cladosporium halotolerans]|uniref:Uncharacterized protein n=1 Tax=Cladosporium halotolerans TaxID=1052096 RepID=A0AB34KHZ5_9PEZI